MYEEKVKAIVVANTVAASSGRKRGAWAELGGRTKRRFTRHESVSTTDF